jgi:hypothetical protein
VVTSSLIATTSSDGQSAVEQYETFFLEKARPFDDAYQKDRDRYLSDIHSVLKRLAIRADEAVKDKIGSIKVHVNNRGRAGVITIKDTIYFDIAILDLLEHAALEYAIADVNGDDYHVLEFHVAYSVALSTDKILRGVNPYNHASFEEEQKKTLWEDVNRYQQIFYRNCLAFILAHEIGHVVLRHNEQINAEFPTEEQKKADLTAWNKRRREIELAADDFAAELSLRTFYQPANIVPWFTLVDTRRTFYGSSPEYPNPKQREAAIRAVYQRWMDAGLWPESEYAWPDPLRPDRDMTKVDKIIGLKNIREVRTFRRDFLAAIDRQMIELINSGARSDIAAAAAVEVVERNRRILGTECESPEKLDELIREIENTPSVEKIEQARVRSLIELACQGKDRREYLLSLLEEDPVNWTEVKGTAALLKNSRPEFADAIQWRHILARTVVRWYADIYKAYLQAVATQTGQKFHYEPYTIGKPLRKAPPSDQEMLEFLRNWNGSYVQDVNSK